MDLDWIKSHVYEFIKIKWRKMDHQNFTSGFIYWVWLLRRVIKTTRILGGGHKYFKNVLGLQKLFTISSNWYFGVLHLAMSQFYGGNGSASAFHSRYGFLVILMVTQLDSLIKMDYQCKWEFRIDSLMQISHSAMIQRAIMKNTK